MESIYGVDVVVKAFTKAVLENDNLRLLLLGGGTLAPLVQGLINQYQIADRVYFGVGRCARLICLHSIVQADLYISASHSDGSSVSLMEALACGVPVLISDIAGNREWITQGKEGWLFKDGDERALTMSILKAYNEKSLRRSQGKAARTLAEERADWKKNFAVLLKAYQTALQQA